MLQIHYMIVHMVDKCIEHPRECVVEKSGYVSRMYGTAVKLVSLIEINYNMVLRIARVDRELRELSKSTKAAMQYYQLLEGGTNVASKIDICPYRVSF